MTYDAMPTSYLSLLELFGDRVNTTDNASNVRGTKPSFPMPQDAYFGIPRKAVQLPAEERKERLSRASDRILFRERR